MRKPNTNRSIFRDWWREIFSISLAIICTILSVAVLLYVDNRSAHEWNLPVQPNTLIASLATLARAALIFPLAECIGHLKWTYFEKPRALISLHLFDSASRGPMGALTFLWRERMHLPLASGAALVTILLLLFQPFAQQTIQFASRSAPMANETAHTLLTRDFSTDKYTEHSPGSDPFYPAVTLGLYKAAFKEAADDSKNAKCSTALCDYPDHYTLAFCSACEEQSLSGSIFDLFENCTLAGTPDRVGKSAILEYVDSRIGEKSSKGSFNSTITCKIPQISPITLSIDYNRRMSPDLNLTLHVFDPVGYLPRQRTSWDKGSFVNSTLEIHNKFVGSTALTNFSMKSCKYEPGHAVVENRNVSVLLNATCVDSTTDLSSYFAGNKTTPQFGMFNGTVTKCSLKPCVKHFTEAKMLGNRFSANITTKPTVLGPETRSFSHKTDDGEELTYSWQYRAFIFLEAYIREELDNIVFLFAHMKTISGGGDDTPSLYERIAEQLSTLIKSPSNNQIQTLEGTAYGSEIYIQVRWPWFFFPLFLTAASTLILALSIWDSSNRVYLFKNKILAAIAFELHGWKREEYDADDDWGAHSMGEFEKKSERMVAKMQLPQHGESGLKLRKE
ncbi:hypothetical protein C7974DRAFT_181757 [Boeremia exigua]|uniref:uncharacterized protein n=1 Tax=Boeremia exigua TaxID=749465 RepID=UPI001E8DCE5A|nr:uncharacterized protein C7974DRAFT_181757 [Boeremia exigua]KAH6629124.1 hypothetical protein C7974DRAFT_181757 [Boeremia exigua]